MLADRPAQRVIDMLELRINRVLLEHLKEMRTDLDRTWKLLDAVTSVCSEVRRELDGAMEPQPSPPNSSREGRKRPAPKVEGAASTPSSKNFSPPVASSKRARAANGAEGASSQEHHSFASCTDAVDGRARRCSSGRESTTSQQRSEVSSSQNVPCSSQITEHDLRPTDSNTNRGDENAFDPDSIDVVEPTSENFDVWAELICEAYDDLAAVVEGLISMEPGPAIRVLLSMWNVLPSPKKSEDTRWKRVLDACRSSPRGTKWMQRFQRKAVHLPEMDFRSHEILHRLRICVSNRWYRWLDLSDSNSDDGNNDDIEVEHPSSHLLGTPALPTSDGEMNGENGLTSQRTIDGLDSASDGNAPLKVADPLDLWAEIICESFKDLCKEVSGLSQLGAIAAARVVLTMWGVLPNPLQQNSSQRWVEFLDDCRNSRSGARWIERYKATTRLPVVDFSVPGAINRIRGRIDSRWRLQSQFSPAPGARSNHDMADCGDSVHKYAISSTHISDRFSLWTDYICKAFDEIAPEIKGVPKLKAASVVRLLFTMWEILPPSKQNAGQPWTAFLKDALNSRSGKKWVQRYKRGSGLPVLDFTDRALLARMITRVYLRRDKHRSGTSKHCSGTSP